MTQSHRRALLSWIGAALAASLALAACQSPAPEDTPGFTVGGTSTAMATPRTPPGLTGTPRPETPNPSPLAPTVGLTISNNGEVGEIVTDTEGRALYAQLNDEPFKSVCAAACLAQWPAFTQEGPVSAPSKPTSGPVPTPRSSIPNIVVGEGALSSLVSSFLREDGILQITYNGWPLYYYSGDTQPGLTAGRNVEDAWGAWAVIDAAGDPVQ